MTGAGVTPVAGNFRMYGATINSATAPTMVGNTSCAGLTSGAYCYRNGTGFVGDTSAATKSPSR